MTSPYITRRRVEHLGRVLSDRDWAVISTVARTRVASARQLERLHFAGVSRRQARASLSSLVARRLLARLPRTIGGVRAGSAGHVFVLDVAGQRLTRPADGRAHRPWAVGTMFLAHSLAVTEVLVGVTEAVRAQSNGMRVVDFRTEPDCWRSFAGPGGARLVLKPDAELVIEVGNPDTGFFQDRWLIEVDRSTESRPTLARKLQRYVQHWQSGREQAVTGVYPRVLWIVPDLARHAVVMDEFAKLPVEAWPIFTVTTSTDATARVLAGAAV